MRIGFEGPGRMGARMAANPAPAGHEFTLWNRSADKASNLAAEIGTRLAKTPWALAEGAALVVTMLADDAAHRGPDGMFAALVARRTSRWAP